ncbi:ABC transporter ATP-binding protein [Corynebacterium diphtheriae]|uniref:ABC transporter ATP-binding protein n=1 Tax=Corynebacterium diphtheriae TaxID=1717 RepID=UPI0002469564|nr:ABC transporter ATP-binding protein [Corynebacterium diphtheriae]AEX70819.1 ATP-binding cassette subfamily C [Corynebacterium diphtheriae PW8]OKY21124.1 ABC transporter [Corynebacterium diphtheriae]UEB38343.1 ABC transporter ATP-binding protein/permease [Corynebacterium diphtheriae]WLF42437.1 ABC transporter ATP-binding protein [Corynebacterium diphtheriae]CAB0619992.1 ABC transporter ATP-binding protein [Corynebacterium diphtheriae]
MSNATSSATSTAAPNSSRSRLHDPLLFRGLAKLQSPNGHRLSKRFLVLSLLVGLLDGLAILTLVPLTSALVNDTPITWWLWVLLAIAVVAFVLRFFATMSSYHTALDFIRTAHNVVGDKLATLPLGWFGPSRTGGLSRLVSDRFMAAGEVVAHIQGTIFRDGAALLTLLVGAWIWNPRLGFTFLVIAPIALGVMQLSAWIRENASDRALPPSKELSNRIVEFASHQPALRAAGRSESFEPLQQALETDHKARVRELWQSTFALLLNGLVVQAFIVALITVAAGLALDGTVSPLETIAIIGISLRFTRSLEQVGSSYVGLDVGRVAIAETTAITDSPSLPEPAEPTIGDGSASVELRNVTFGYGNTPVLKDVSFVARPGTVTAIVGPSGSGKTTIARLISRFWDVDSGAVLVDGVDIRLLGTEQLMARLSMVFQDVYLFDDSLIANIRVGRPDASDEDVYRAADLAGVTSIAKRLGWDTSVGEGGRLLSGGERQRVSVARALLKQAPIVLFDEATSALDAENEANILASMEKLRAASTFIVIAHKLDTIRSADQIVVLNNQGQVSQLGTHNELYGTPGVYQHFWKRREAARGWVLSGSEH